MNSDYREGFDDALEHMYYYLERLELKSKQCMELCMLMNMMGEWNNLRSYEENIKFARQKIEEVRLYQVMSNPKYSCFIENNK